MFEREVPVTSAVVFVPLTSFPRFTPASSWYMLRFCPVSEWIEVFIVSRLDALALAEHIHTTLCFPVGVWFLGASGAFELEVSYA